jgi:hypothetical protein
MLRIACAAALAVLPVATPAAAEAEPFDLLTTACLQTSARRDAVAETLTKAEWTGLPGEAFGLKADEGQEPWTAFVRPDDMQASDPTRIQVFLTGWTTAEAFIDVPDLGAEFCALLNSGDKVVMDRKMEHLLGFPPQTIEADQVWIFSRDERGYRAEPTFLSMSEDEAATLSAERQIFIASTITREGANITLIGAIRPRS